MISTDVLETLGLKNSNKKFQTIFCFGLLIKKNIFFIKGLDLESDTIKQFFDLIRFIIG